MKKLLPGLCLALVLSAVGPVPNASARDWWWHRHHKDNNSGDAKPTHKEKTKKSWFHHHEKANKTQDVTAFNAGPRSVGHWHPMPGPAGYGAN
jgi:hypothetical protein